MLASVVLVIKDGKLKCARVNMFVCKNRLHVHNATLLCKPLAMSKFCCYMLIKYFIFVDHYGLTLCTKSDSIIPFDSHRGSPVV